MLIYWAGAKLSLKLPRHPTIAGSFFWCFAFYKYWPSGIFPSKEHCYNLFWKIFPLLIHPIVQSCPLLDAMVAHLIVVYHQKQQLIYLPSSQYTLNPNPLCNCFNSYHIVVLIQIRSKKGVCLVAILFTSKICLE